ncbi:hypothetical protein EDD18DRAFT_1080982 [Armillaria luteobubalina]|uniref:Uncharacterized protein n=1 Tax=Armillaria luteobubalina TaxID=153913 RepID=A0AA39UJ51_9AGAR|nr:hypothetical protein EDD18DRAFT_1080982 [Armillaria luteobubalina]
MEQVLHWHAIIAAATYYVQLMTVAILLYASPSYWTQPYHTSALSGAAWVNELVHGHPERINSLLSFACFLAWKTLAMFF